MAGARKPYGWGSNTLSLIQPDKLCFVVVDIAVLFSYIMGFLENIIQKDTFLKNNFKNNFEKP